MKTKLIEFKNKEKELLRGILSLPDKSPVKAVLMCGGFERSTTTEKKFKALADELNNHSIPSLRFDYSGCGLSDGDFSKTTIKRMAKELMQARKLLERKTNCDQIVVIAHSLSACVIAKSLSKVNFKKIILFAPALNQKELHRFWFVVSAIKKVDHSINITWQNYREYLNEKDFRADMERTDKTTKANFIGTDYFQENSNKDYSNLFDDTSNILLVHGNKDDKVPFESITKTFTNTLIIKDGDHDMERPDMLKQWLSNAIEFIEQ